MRRGLLLVLGVALVVAAQGLRADDKKDLEAIKGAWSFVSLEGPDGGKPPEDKIKAMRLEFTGEKMIFKDDSRTTEATFKIDSSKKPKTIDLVPTDGDQKGKTFQAIYEVDGDNLKICLSETGSDRPKEFAVNKETKTGLMVLKRVKE